MPTLERRNPHDIDNPYRVGQINEQGQQICGSKLRGKEEKCNRSPLKGRDRCRLHGGVQERGAGHPNAKQLLYSKYLTEDIAERYEAGLQDPELVSLRHEIAYINTIIQDMMQLSALHLTVDRWNLIQDVWGKFWAAAMTGNAKAQQVHAHELNVLIVETTEGEKANKFLDDKLKLKQRLVSAEQKRMLEAQQMVTIEQAMTLLTAMMFAIREAAYMFTTKDAADQIIIYASERYKKITGEGDEKYLGIVDG